ncbi:MAG TPA: undecaprenyldiphospho-muramoylpentapeptide beta-N-acetylglucosaminyltransferase [Haloplasmataceae bacterium]
MRLLFCGGGTGGHIYPAIALIKFIRKKEPDTEILYIGKLNSQEEKICLQENIPFIGIKVSSLYRKKIYLNIKTFYQFIKACCQSKKIINNYKPDCIIGTGGYVCAPVVFAGAKKKVKTIIHEQNSIPGFTNKLLSRYCTKIAISFLDSKKYFKEEKVVLTGNPRSQEVLETPKKKKEELGLQEDKKLILIFMGSLGAQYVNDEVVKILPRLMRRKDLEIVFVTGKTHYEKIMNDIKNLKLQPNVHIKAYIDNMPEYLLHADLVICRAGATTLSEICAIGIPTILIPSPYVTNNHQEKNALSLVNNKGAIMIKEKELNEDDFFSQIISLLDDPFKRSLLRLNNKKSGIPNSCDKFLELINSIVN